MYFIALKLCKMNYMILHADLQVQVHDCRPAVCLLAVAELGSLLIPISEMSSKLDSLELFMRMCECKPVRAELGPSLEFLLETSFRAVG